MMDGCLNKNDTICNSLNDTSDLDYDGLTKCEWEDTARYTQVAALGLITFAILAGNTFVIYLVFRNKTMRKTVDLFIVNLAICDVMLAVFNIPLELEWKIAGDDWKVTGTTGMVLCKVTNYLAVLPLVVCAITLLFISIERYRALSKPLIAAPITRTTLSMMIAITWVLGLATNSYILYFYDLLETGLCSYKSSSYVEVFFGVDSAITLIILVTVIIINILLYRKIRRSTQAIHVTVQSQQARNKRIRGAVKMVFCSSCTYLICIIPYHLFQFSAAMDMQFYLQILKNCSDFKALRITVFFLLYFNSAINPVFYFTFMADFRNALKAALRPARVAATTESRNSIALAPRTGNCNASRI